MGLNQRSFLVDRTAYKLLQAHQLYAPVKAFIGMLFDWNMSYTDIFFKQLQATPH